MKLMAMSLLAATVTLGAGALTSTHEAHAQSSCGLQISVRFIEGAPRDRFHISNTSTTGWKIDSLSFDLAPSRGGLIFDTMQGGQGVEVFQKFLTENSSASLRGVDKLVDGGTELTLEFDRFDTGDKFQFSLDVDDTLGATDPGSSLGQIRVSSSEIVGAEINVVVNGPKGETETTKLVFNETSRASTNISVCS